MQVQTKNFGSSPKTCGDMRFKWEEEVKKNFRKVRSELLGQNRAILKFIQMNLSPESTALEELMGLGTTSTDAAPSAPVPADDDSDIDMPQGFSSMSHLRVLWIHWLFL